MFFVLLTTTIQGIIIITNPGEENGKQKKQQQQPNETKSNLWKIHLKWPKIFADQSKTKKQNKIWYSKHTNQDEWEWMNELNDDDDEKWLAKHIDTSFLFPPISFHHLSIQQPIMFTTWINFQKKIIIKSKLIMENYC